MKNRYDEAIRFKNGNINIKLFPETIEKLKSGKVSLMESLSNALFAVDCYLYGESFCIGNYDMAVSIYNYYSDKCYIVLFSEIDKLLDGKTLKLYATNPTETDRELINNY